MALSQENNFNYTLQVEGQCYRGGRYTDAYLRQPTLDARVSLQLQTSAADWLWPPRGCALEVKRAERARGANKARLHNTIMRSAWLRPWLDQRVTSVTFIETPDLPNLKSIMRFTRETFLSAVTLKCSMFISYVKDFFIALVINLVEVIYIFLNFYRSYILNIR